MYKIDFKKVFSVAFSRLMVKECDKNEGEHETLRTKPKADFGFMQALFFASKYRCVAYYIYMLSDESVTIQMCNYCFAH